MRRATNAHAFWARVDVQGFDDCWLWRLVRDKDGYGLVSVKNRQRRAHVFAWELTHGPSELQILHRCDNPPCVNPAHLFEGTQLDNMLDKYAKGREGILRGERAPGAKLTADAVLEIRSCGHEQGKQLAKRFGVSPQTICDIRKGRIWSSLSQ